MNIKKIDHVGIVVKSIDEAAATYERNLGLKFLHKEHNEDFQCDIAFFQCGNILVELVEPLGPSLAKTWLETKGEGINHICYEVDDINEAFQEAKEKGTLIDATHGRRTRAVIITDSDLIILTYLQSETVAARLEDDSDETEEDDDE